MVQLNQDKQFLDNNFDLFKIIVSLHFLLIQYHVLHNVNIEMQSVIRKDKVIVESKPFGKYVDWYNKQQWCYFLSQDFKWT